MKSYYPRIQQIQEKVEEECELLDYEGSRLYDEYPDKYMIYHLCRRYERGMEAEISSRRYQEVFWMNWYKYFCVRKSPEDAAGDAEACNHAAGDSDRTALYHRCSV